MIEGHNSFQTDKDKNVQSEKRVFLNKKIIQANFQSKFLYISEKVTDLSPRIRETFRLELC